MRNKWFLITILLVLLCYFLYTCIIKPHGGPDRTTGNEIKDSSSYKRDQVIVIFKNPPTPAQINIIKEAYLRAGLTDSIVIKKCSECDDMVQLWAATNIETYISTDGIKAGSSGTSKGAGEDSLAKYGLNYINSFPDDPTIPKQRIDSLVKEQPVDASHKDTVVIAVMDTGLDTMRIDSGYLWRNTSERTNTADDDHNCLVDDRKGWNFVNGTPNIQDNNPNIHGTLVSKYIINQFRTSASNFVQIMVLKTHDQYGRADLFNTICAIHYAINKGAKIINASWGFYNYGADPLPYLDSLVTQVLPTHGILFFAAAGNRIPLNDSLANEMYRSSHAGASVPSPRMLRDLAFNSFYPACLSSLDNNVITVTTTDGALVSATQNYSDKFVDMAVLADSVTADHMYFKQPFRSLSYTENYISGSSFATPIAAGKIGSVFNHTMYRAGVKKSDLFTSPLAPAFIQVSAPLRDNGLVRDGRFSKQHP